MTRPLYLIPFAAVLLFTATRAAEAQLEGIQYARGQDVAPAFEGWGRNPDGTRSLYFGYMNRNHEEEVDIPIGPDNRIDPGGDQGQPTHFYARRQRAVFKIVVPNDWDPQRKIAWSLTVHGKTNSAKGWLQPEWELNDEILMENSGGATDLDNKAPTVTGTGPQTVIFPNPVTLSVSAQDDGLPRPRRRQAEGDGSAGRDGVRVRWIEYRGPGAVLFDPDSTDPVYGKQVTSTTQATFSSPGVYVLRAIVGDGSLETFHDVTVSVKPR